MSAVSYHGRRFRHPGDDSGLTGHYGQNGDTVWADFAGGPVRVGRLVGRCGPDGVLDAAYCQVLADGTVVAGQCLSTPTVLADGRLLVEERWRRFDGSTGVSWIEEVAG